MEKSSGGISGTFPPRGHSRLPSTDSGIQMDSGWDSLTRSHPGKVITDSHSVPDSKTSQKTAYSCLTQAHTTSTTQKQNCPWFQQATPNSPTNTTTTITRLNTTTTAPQKDIRAVTRSPDVRMTSGDDGRFGTAFREADVTVTSVGLKPTSPPTSPSKSGVSKTINIQILGQSNNEQKEKGNATKIEAGKIFRSSKSVSRTFEKDMPVNIDIHDVQSERANSRPEHQPSVSEQSKSSPSTFGSRQLSCGSNVHSEHFVSDAKYSRTDSDPLRYPLKELGSELSPERQPSKAESKGKNLRLKTFVSSERTFSPPPSSPRALSPEGKVTSPLTLLTSTTPVIPSRPTQNRGVGSPRGGEWIVGGRGIFVAQSKLSGGRSEGADHSQTRLLSSSSSDASARQSHTQGGSETSRNNKNELQQGPGAGQSACSKVHSIPIRLVSNVSKDGTSNVSISNNRTGDTNIQGGHIQTSSADHVSTEKVPHSPDTSAQGKSSSSSSSSQSLYIGTPVVGSQRFIIPKVNSVQSVSPQIVSPRVSVTPVRMISPTQQPASQRMSPKPGAGPQTQTSHCVTSLTRPRHATPMFRSKLSPILPRNVAHVRPPLSSRPAPSLSQPILVKHVIKPVKRDSAPASPNSQSQRDNSSDTYVTSVSSNGASPPEELLKLLEMTTAMKEKMAGGKGKGAGGGVERRIPIVDARREVPWGERRRRMDSALSWLRGELESLREMDTALMTQFQRCQDTIESLKQQQEWRWGDGEGSEWGWGIDSSEFDEEDEAWEDWEIAEFEKQWGDDPEVPEGNITMLPAVTVATGNSDGNDDDVISTFSDVTSTETTSSRSREKSSSPITQDVEAAV